MGNTAPTLGYLSAAPRVSTRNEAEHGGARAHVLGVMQAFEALGWGVMPFIVGDRVPANWVTEGSESVIRHGGVKALAADLVRIAMGLANAYRAWRELGCQVDYVYERNATLQSLGWIFKRHGVPWILETNGPLFHEAKTNRKTLVLSSLARILELWTYRKCDLLVCVSETLRDILIDELGIPGAKIFVMPNGVDTAFFDPGKYPATHEYDGLTIGFVGRLYEWNGLDLLLQAIREISDEGVSLRLIVVGDGKMKKQWEADAALLGLKDTVRFVGHVARDKVPSYTASFDIGYSGQIPSQMGTLYGSPIKLYEYMAMAKPVIASSFEDACRAIVDGETGYLFEAGDKESLKATLRRVYQDRARLTEMGQKAREIAIREHSWESRVRGLLGALDATPRLKERLK